MRIGKRMWEVLQVLNETSKGLTTTEIIMKIEGLKPYKSKYQQSELASAIIKKSISYYMTGGITVIQKSNGKTYDGHEYANKWYALYSRSIKLLYKNKLIFPLGNNKTKRKFKITLEGRWKLHKRRLRLIERRLRSTRLVKR